MHEQKKEKTKRCEACGTNNAVRKKIRQEEWYLFCHIRVHLVICLPFPLGSINIKAGTSAKVITVILSFNVASTLRKLKNTTHTTCENVIYMVTSSECQLNRNALHLYVVERRSQSTMLTKFSRTVCPKIFYSMHLV